MPYAHFVVLKRIASVCVSSGQMWNPVTLCNFLTHSVEKIVDRVTSESLTFFSLDT